MEVLCHQTTHLKKIEKEKLNVGYGNTRYKIAWEQ